MIVVTDTSVILNLCLLGLQQALPLIFGEVHAPPAVREEFLRLVSVDPRFVILFPLRGSMLDVRGSTFHPLGMTDVFTPEKRGVVSVLNPKGLGNFLKGRPAVLSIEQQRAIANQLEESCRIDLSRPS